MSAGSTVAATACEGVLIGSQPWKRIHCPGCADAAALREQLARAQEPGVCGGFGGKTRVERFGCGMEIWMSGTGASGYRCLSCGMVYCKPCLQHHFESESGETKESLRATLATAESLALTNGEARDRAEREKADAIRLYEESENRHCADLRIGIDAAIESYRREILSTPDMGGPPGLLHERVVTLVSVLSAAEAERDELRRLLTSARAVIVHSSFAVGASAARAWLDAHPAAAAIPEGTPIDRK